MVDFTKLPNQYRFDRLAASWPSIDERPFAEELTLSERQSLRILRGRIAIGIVHEFPKQTPPGEHVNCRCTLPID